MKKFKILIPVYNDWKSVFKLLDKIDEEISIFDNEFSVIVVNDASTEKLENTSFNYKNLKSVTVLNMKKNQGHTRCNATGIKYLSEMSDFDFLIVMDGDGEDRPEDLRSLINEVLSNKNISFVAKRKKRSEGIVFTILYHLHKIITYVFTGKNMNFGHYSCLTREDVILLSTKKSLWSSYAGTTKKYIKKLNELPTIRGKRYFGISKIPIIGLMIHSFSIIAVFKYQVFARSTLFFLLSFLFFKQFTLFVIFFQTMLFIFVIIIFMTSRRESLEALSNSPSQIGEILDIHTKRL